MIARELFNSFRPANFEGRGDRYLFDSACELRRKLDKAQRTAGPPSLDLASAQLDNLAIDLIEMAEDLHNEIGLWAGFERFNQAQFGTPLQTVPPGTTIAPGFHPDRFLHFLWNWYLTVTPGMLVPPRHAMLQLFAETACQYLTERFRRMPRDSGVAQFFRLPNELMKIVQHKLFWLGTRSYLFRSTFSPLLAREETPERQARLLWLFCVSGSTLWSGLSPLELLSWFLDLTEMNRMQLRAWPDRPFDLVEVVSVEPRSATQLALVTKDLLSPQIYPILIPPTEPKILAGQWLMGTLLPWQDHWEWLDEPRLVQVESEADRPRILADFEQRRAPLLAAQRQAARTVPSEAGQRRREQFIARFGKEWTVFPDGQTALAALKGLEPEESVSPEWFAWPPQLLDCQDGIGVFAHPVLGDEVVPHFHGILDSLKKQGQALTEEEANELVIWAVGLSASAEFLTVLTREFGLASLGAALLVPELTEKPGLEYFLHRNRRAYHQQHQVLFPGA